MSDKCVGLVCTGALVVFILRPDLRRAILTAGLVGGLVESLSEVWYLRDYWQPITLLPVPTPEDFLYGFGVTALAVCAVPFWLRRAYEPSTMKSSQILTVMLFVVFAGAMNLGIWLEHVPSIWIATTTFALIGVCACLRRPDLAPIGLTAGAIMGVVAFTGYGLGLNYVVDGNEFLARVWLLAGSHWDIRVAGVPLDEITWNITRGFCAAILYPLISAQKLTRLQNGKPKK